MSLKQLQQTLETEPTPNLILLYGQESYFIERAWFMIRDHVVPPDARDFNLTQIYGKELNAQETMDQARTFPVFADHRIVYIKNADEARNEQLDGLLPYLEDPVPETVLVVTAEKIDGRRKVFQLLKKKGLSLEFKKIYENQLPSFVKELAKSFKITLTADALELFCKRVGTNLAEVEGELEKLAGYLGKSDLAEKADVAAIVSDSRLESIFDLTDAIGEGDRAKALFLLNRLMSEGQPALMILSMITRHFRQMRKIKAYLEQNVSQGELPRKMGISPYFLKGMTRQAKRFDVDQYKLAFEQFLYTDLALKSTSTDPKLVLERLILEVSNIAEQSGINIKGETPGKVLPL